MNSSLENIGRNPKDGGVPDESLDLLMRRVRNRLQSVGICERRAALQSDQHPFWGYISKAEKALTGPIRKIMDIPIDEEIEPRSIKDCFRNPEIVFRRDPEIDDVFQKPKKMAYLGELAACQLCCPASFRDIAAFVVNEKGDPDKIASLFLQRVHDVTPDLIDTLLEKHKDGKIDLGLLQRRDGETRESKIASNLFFAENSRGQLSVLEVTGNNDLFGIDVNRFDREYNWAAGTNVYIFNYNEQTQISS